MKNKSDVYKVITISQHKRLDFYLNSNNVLMMNILIMELNVSTSYQSSMSGKDKKVSRTAL